MGFGKSFSTATGPTASSLAVGGFGAVFALIVVFGNVQWNPGIGRPEQDASEGQAGDELENVGVFDGLGGRSSPDKGSVAGDQDAGDGEGVEVFAAEAAHDDGAGVEDFQGPYTEWKGKHN